MLSPRRKGGAGGKIPWGWGLCFPSFAFCQALGAFHPGDHLHLTGHCVQLSVSVSLFLSPRNFPSFSLPCLISTVIRTQSGEGVLKVFSTFDSHFTVGALYYDSRIFTYMRPNSKAMNEKDKVISVFCSIMTSMLNPITYSLRNKDVKVALRKLSGRQSTFGGSNFWHFSLVLGPLWSTTVALLSSSFLLLYLPLLIFLSPQEFIKCLLCGSTVPRISENE